MFTLHLTYLSYMTDCHFVYVILSEGSVVQHYNLLLVRVIVCIVVLQSASVCNASWYCLLQYSVDPNDYFGNAFRVWDYVRKRELRRVMEGTPKTQWFVELAPTDINAFYSPSLNQFSKSVIFCMSPHHACSSSQYFFLEYLDVPYLLLTGLSKLHNIITCSYN